MLWYFTLVFLVLPLFFFFFKYALFLENGKEVECAIFLRGTLTEEESWNSFKMLSFPPLFFLQQFLGLCYFCVIAEKVAELFVGCGFEVLSNEYVHRTTENKKEGLCVPRIFVQARLRKPMGMST